MTAFLNLGSLAFGFAAWGLPFAAIVHKSRFWICCLGSFGCCILALLFQLIEVKRLTALGDWSALMDTIPAVVMAAFVLIIVMVVCNLFVLLRSPRG